MDLKSVWNAEKAAPNVSTMTNASVAILVISYPIKDASKTVQKELFSMTLLLCVSLALTIAIHATQMEAVFPVTPLQTIVYYLYLHQDAFR